MRFLFLVVALVGSMVAGGLACPQVAEASGGGVGPFRAASVRLGQNRAAVRQLRAAELNARAFEVQKLQAVRVQPVYVQPLRVQRIVVPQAVYVQPFYAQPIQVQRVRVPQHIRQLLIVR